MGGGRREKGVKPFSSSKSKSSKSKGHYDEEEKRWPIWPNSISRENG
jgi:hypothetical protein